MRIRGLLASVAAALLLAGSLCAEPRVLPYTEPDLSSPVLPPLRPFAELPPALGSVYGGVEYLHWKLRDLPLPVPLLTSAESQDSTGLIDRPGTRLLLGNEYVSQPWRDGGRFTLGMWFDDQRGIGVEGSGFFVAAATTQTGFADPTGEMRLAVPYIGATRRTAAVYPLSGRTAAGEAGLAVSSQLIGGDLYCLVNTCEYGTIQIDALFGARYLYLYESLTYTTRTAPLTGAGEALLTRDWFGTYNQFAGPGAGLSLSWSAGRLSANLLAKVAYGIMSERVNITGETVTARFNTPAGGAARTFAGGLFAQPTNIGHTAKVRMAVLPEANLTVGVQLLTNLRASIGYGFLYTDSVARPGDQIDPRINSSQSVALTGKANPPGIGTGRAQPERTVTANDFWAHGLNLGLEFQF